MRIVSLVEVVRGRLLNAAQVEAVGSVAFAGAKVKRGDCYFHLSGNEAELELALRSGAFAVVFCGGCQIRDVEVAWIQVESFDRALAGVLRYRLIEQKAKVYQATPETVSIAASLITDTRLIATQTIETAITRLGVAGAADPILLCEEGGQIAVATAAKEPIVPAEITVRKAGIFETTIAHKDREITIALSSLFANDLARAIGLSRSESLELNLSRSISIARFAAYPIRSGASVLIFDSADDREAEIAAQFIRKTAPWAKTIAPPQMPISELIRIIKTNPFQYAYLRGFSKDETIAALARAELVTNSLFG
ncbi:hypothetical protein AGMMS49521_1340 [Campylobacterota bacterium]|nr:hypothetical protein AGMMS49521_1340 [Campylobacterota bacterium]